MRFEMISKNDVLLQDFVNRLEALTKVRLPMDYMRHADTWAVFEGKQMVAGYMLVLGEPMRCLNFFSKEQRETIPALKTISPSEMVEITGIWTEPTLENRKYVSSRMWIHAYWRIFRSGKSYLIYGYNNNLENLRSLYKHANSIVLYNGSSKKQKDLETPTHASVSVEITKVSSMQRAIIKGAIRRALRAKKVHAQRENPADRSALSEVGQSAGRS